jgi:hypothetical protein
MVGGRRHDKLKKEQVESWLEQILIPVEPDARFIRRLRARLVTYQGSKLSSGWMVVVVLATTLLFAITAFGLLIRILLGWVGLIRIMRKKDRETTEPQAISA